MLQSSKLVLTKKIRALAQMEDEAEEAVESWDVDHVDEAIEPSECVIHGLEPNVLAEGMRVKTEGNFTIEARDRQGNTTHAGGGAFFILIRGASSIRRSCLRSSAASQSLPWKVCTRPAGTAESGTTPRNAGRDEFGTATASCTAPQRSCTSESRVSVMYWVMYPGIERVE